MIHLRIIDATHRMDPPPGSGPEIRPLFVRRVDDCFVSSWELTHDEIAMIQEGSGVVELWIMGNAHPPVALRVV